MRKFDNYFTQSYCVLRKIYRFIDTTESQTANLANFYYSILLSHTIKLVFLSSIRLYSVYYLSFIVLHTRQLNGNATIFISVNSKGRLIRGTTFFYTYLYQRSHSFNACTLVFSMIA